MTEAHHQDSMSNVEPSNRESTLAVKDVEAWIEGLTRELTLPEGGLLRGEVLGTSGDGRRGQLRGPAGRAAVELRLEEPLEAKRGDIVEVAGQPELVAEAAPVGLRLVWRGTVTKNWGTSPRFRARRAALEERAAKLPFTTPRIDAGLRSGGRVRLVAERRSKAWADVEEAGRQYRWFKPDPSFCEDMRDPASLAATLTAVLPLVNTGDVVLVAGGSTDFEALDVFEDERVVGALVRLTARCPTILAVGHDGDELLTNKVVTYPIDTARAAIQLIVTESGEPSGEPRGPGPVEPEGAEISRRPSARGTGPLPPGALLRLLLLGVAVFLGWWARGAFASGGAPPSGAAPSSAPVVSPAAR
jgi:hypothetical protein